MIKYKILHLPTATYMYVLNKECKLFKKLKAEEDIKKINLNLFYSQYELETAIHGYSKKDATEFFETEEIAEMYIEYWSKKDINTTSLQFDEHAIITKIHKHLFEIIEVEVD